MCLCAEAGCHDCHVPPLFESERYVSRIGGADPGRAAVTGDPAEAGAVRVPTLRNARDTEPYFHDGSVMTLEDAVRIEAEISAARGEGRALSQDELELVVKFVNKALVDRTRDPHRPKEVPSGLDVPEDGFRIPR
jgi:cytochrome c peroxidase